MVPDCSVKANPLRQQAHSSRCGNLQIECRIGLSMSARLHILIAFILKHYSRYVLCMNRVIQGWFEKNNGSSIRLIGGPGHDR